MGKVVLKTRGNGCGESESEGATSVTLHCAPTEVHGRTERVARRTLCLPVSPAYLGSSASSAKRETKSPTLTPAARRRFGCLDVFVNQHRVHVVEEKLSSGFDEFEVHALRVYRASAAPCSRCGSTERR